MSMNLKGKRRRRGSVLLLSIFFLIVLFSLAVTFFRIIPAEFHSATQARRGIQAQYAADAGVREAVAWLKIQPAVDDAKLAAFTSAHNSPSTASQKVDDDWSYTVGMTTADPVRKIYDVVSVAYFRGTAVSEIRTTVRNETFAKYALFYDTWGDDFLYTMAPDAIQGPFHTNQFFHLSVPAGTSFWDKDGKDPFVNGALAEMTFSQPMVDASNPLVGKGDGSMYYGGNYNGSDAYKRPYADDGVPDADRYNKIIKGGREKITQIAKVDFPEAVTELRVKAWDASGSAPDDAVLAAAVTSKGPLLVNTDAGPNAAGGKLKGGILYAKNAKAVSLDITETNGNHQKTTITDVEDTKVPGAGATTYSWKEEKYSKNVPQPDKKKTTGGNCIKSHKEKAIRKVKVKYTVKEMRQDPSCGTETVFIPGSGGVSTPIKVNKTCLVDVQKEKEVDEEYDKTVCDEYAPTVITWVPQPDKVVDSVKGASGAYLNGTTNKSGSTPPPTGTFVPDTVTSSTSDLLIPTVNSVVEVNDADYKIPYYSGMKVNGKTITDPSDSLLTVKDGNTVTIKNDVVVSGKNYAEYTVMEGRVNGVMFSDGDLRGLKGTAKGSKYVDELGNLAYRGRTIAADIQKDKDIEISNSILQYYDGDVKDAKGNPLKNSKNQLVPGNQSPNADHILGMIARNVTIKQDTSVNSKTFDMASDRDANGKVLSYLKGLTVYGVVMAGRKVSATKVDGGFGADASAMQSSDDLGDFNLFGGIISGNARSTQSQNGGSVDGFRLNLNYDEIAALNLENFPTTNQYSVVRYVTVRRGSLDTGFGGMGGK